MKEWNVHVLDAWVLVRESVERNTPHVTILQHAHVPVAVLKSKKQLRLAVTQIRPDQVPIGKQCPEPMCRCRQCRTHGIIKNEPPFMSNGGIGPQCATIRRLRCCPAPCLCGTCVRSCNPDDVGGRGGCFVTDTESTKERNATTMTVRVVVFCPLGIPVGSQILQLLRVAGCQSEIESVVNWQKERGPSTKGWIQSSRKMWQW